MDLSRTGARIRADVPVETFRKVRVTSEHPGFGRAGIVRYCVRRSNKFVIGVEFSDPPPPLAANPSPSHS